MDISSKVPGGFKNALIADYLAARFTYFSAEKWRELVGNGRLTHNGRPCTLETRSCQGRHRHLPSARPRPCPKTCTSPFCMKMNGCWR
ncbi:MAG: hypothetical protein M5U34_42800 [Chloroflexi bacterium]|nr:hypothetical protein [Chloroflexota bacterium]